MAIPAHKTEYFIIENSILQKKANTADGHKYLGKRKDYAALKSYITKTLRKYGIYNVNYIYKTK